MPRQMMSPPGPSLPIGDVSSDGEFRRDSRRPAHSDENGVGFLRQSTRFLRQLKLSWRAPWQHLSFSSLGRSRAWASRSCYPRSRTALRLSNAYPWTTSRTLSINNRNICASCDAHHSSRSRHFLGLRVEAHSFTSIPGRVCRFGGRAQVASQFRMIG